MRDIDARSLSRGKKDRILERDDFCCAYCFGPADEVDHVTPWSFLHDDSEENLVACCWLCNRIASDKVFPTMSRKRDHILYQRERYVKSHVISLWTRDELKELGRKLVIMISNECVVCDDQEELARVRRRLMMDGFRVVDHETVLSQKRWEKLREERELSWRLQSLFTIKRNAKKRKKRR